MCVNIQTCKFLLDLLLPTYIHTYMYIYVFFQIYAHTYLQRHTHRHTHHSSFLLEPSCELLLSLSWLLCSHREGCAQTQARCIIRHDRCRHGGCLTNNKRLFCGLDSFVCMYVCMYVCMLCIYVQYDIDAGTT